MTSSPNVNAFGLWRVKEPWVVPLIPHKCVKVEVMALELDYVSTYAVRGLSKEEFVSDVDAGASMVTLEAPDGTLVTLPSTYIEVSPTEPAVPYSTILLSLDLGAQPTDLDVTEMSERLTTLGLGLTHAPVVRKHIVPNPIMVYGAVHKSLEDDRAALTAAAAHTDQELVVRNMEIDELRTHVRRLETVLKAQKLKLEESN